jgi:hypothetical protein
MAKSPAEPTSRPPAEPTPEATSPAWRVRLRLALRYAFLLATFAIILHFNVVRPYLLDGQEMDVAAADAPAWLRPPAAAYHALVDNSGRVGLALVWRMYSPVPQRVFHTELTAQDASGRWLPLASPGLPREYREQRSLLAALFWDFKRARINDNYFIYRYESWLPLHYLAVSRERIVRELGLVPRAVRVRVQSAPIPAPSARGDWQPDRAVFDKIVWEEVYR